MLDYQHIVDDIRSAFDSQDYDGMDFLRAAAADYSVACDEINERLRHCATLLRRGLRSEAIQLCEMEPNLLDAVAVLDFPERSQWIETAQQCGMAPLPPLMIDVAADLNEAYALEQPLGALLKRHRLLALCHGALSLRIRVLRQLASLDAGNGVWQEDLRVFELDWHKQIESQVHAARRAGDAAALKALDAEVAGQGWANPPPAALLRLVAETKAKAVCESTQKLLDKLSFDLEAALANSDEDGALALRDRWNAIIAESGFPPEQKIADRAAPAMNWLGQRDEWQREEEERREAIASLKQALAALKQALAAGATLDELQDRFRHAATLGGVPAELESDYHARVAAIERAIWLRRCLKMSGIAAACSVAVLTVVAGVLYVRGEQAVSAAAKKIPAMIEAGELAQADAFVKSLPPRIVRSPSVQEAIVQLNGAMDTEGNRKAAFGEQLALANRVAANVREAIFKEQTQAALAGYRDELDGIQKELGQAAKLAKTSQELTAANAAREAAAQLEKEWQRKIDQAFLFQCEEFDTRLTAIANDKIADPKTIKARLADFTKSLKRWEITSGRVSSSLSHRIKTFHDRLVATENGAEQRDKEDRGLQGVVAAIGESAKYLLAVQDFVRDNPNSNHTPEFKQVIQEAAFWDAVNEWNNLAEPWNRSGMAGLRPEVAKEQMSKAKRTMDLFAETPDQAIPRLLTCMEAIARRSSDDERIDAPLRKMFGDSLVADVALLVRVGGERYYVKSEPKLDEDRPKPFKYAIGFDGKEKGSLMRKDEVKSFGPSPQAVVAKQIQPILDALDDTNWEKGFCRMIAIIAKDRDMDPILKARLLQKTIEAGSRGSYCMEKAFGRYLQWFRDAKIDLFANWLDPVDSAVADVRKDAARKLDGIPDIEGPLRAVEQNLSELKELRMTEYHWVGSLQKDQGTGWTCVMKRTPDANGALVVICRQAPGKKPVFRTVGQLDSKGAAVNAAESDWLLEGRPVYLAKP